MKLRITPATNVFAFTPPARTLALGSVLLLLGTACRGIETGKTRLEREGRVYTLALAGERGWFGNQAVYFDSFVKALKGELKPAGRLPVRVSDAYPLGAGL